MKKLLLFSLLLIVVLTGCFRSEIITKNYYILEYYNHTEIPQLKQEKPLDLSVYIMDTKVSKTYNRNQMVIRHFGPRITYSYYDLWGVKLSKIIPDLLQQRLQAYNVFSQTNREAFGVNPDMEIISNLNNIELYQSETVQQARINIDFVLRKIGAEGSIVTHNANVEKRLLSNDVEGFVQAANEILLEEMDKFINQIIGSCTDEECLALPSDQTESDKTIQQFPLEEEEETPKGNGLLFMPALSNSENEPNFIVRDQNGNQFEGQMGVPLPLLEGIYSLHYGSGKVDQTMTKTGVQIIPRYKTIIEPDWGCLIIDVIDEQRNYAKVRYEIFELETGESFGGGFPAEEEIGEQSKVYVLEKGLYKITINNQPFNTYRDFTTTYVEPGEAKRLTIVVETDEDDNPLSMVGAGVLEESFLEDSGERLKFSSAIHGNANVNSDNEDDEDKSNTTISLNAQLQNYLIYDDNVFHYNMKNLIEIGTQKLSDQDFRLNFDEFDIKNTGIYYFLKNIGLYARFDANSHFFDKFEYYDSDFVLHLIDSDGNTSQDSVVSKVKIKSSVFPLVLKEGFGINYRILNRSKANLSLRAGFGMRQDINNNYYQEINAYEINGITHREFKETKSESKTGMEVSLVGNFTLPWDLTYNINADFLFPFGEEQDYTMEWENVFNMKLFRYISLDYKLKLIHKIPEAASDYIALNHSLFLRVTYFLR
ncbi:MAG: PqiC family protein [Candidatus Cloacimonetes bacterium]|nr:PqiC family protein [Candidatus Cloacimonadota bacterium]MCF7814831.1 PqiC family protein [Candidatus Cloacimonadota bacterium]MCF7883315.1 PqiC family protein [Candidatus Cloacimonadota bacterium]